MQPHVQQQDYTTRSEDDDDDGSVLSHKSEGQRINPFATNFACHFAKLDPVIGRDHWKSACQGPGWADIHRVKEHLYRCHRTFPCDRCFIPFDTEASLLEHRRKPECQVLSTPEHGRLIMGIDESKEKSLRRRQRGMSEHQKWYEIWNILFPPTILPPETPYRSEEFYLERPDAQRAVGRILLELKHDLLKEMRSTSQLQNHAAAGASLEHIEHAIQTCVDNALRKWAPVVSTTALPSERSPPVDMDSTEATLDTSKYSPALPPPNPPTGVDLQTMGTPRVQFMCKPRLDRKTWSEHYGVLKKLYMDLDKPLPDVMRAMRNEYGFTASVKQYRYQLGEIWGWKKYNNPGVRPSRRVVPAEPGASEAPRSTYTVPEDYDSLESWASTERIDTVLTPLPELPMTPGEEEFFGIGDNYSSAWHPKVD